MRSLRRIALLFFIGLAGTFSAHADGIISADLQIQGAGLKVITVSATTGVDIPATIQTEFGGKQNDDAPAIEGLLAVGELTGPGIDTPIRLETAPGHKFQVPALSREGVYFLQNIRLMRGSDYLQPAVPSVATITVTNLLQTTVKVHQLTTEELRARGITIDERNFEVFEYTFSFFVDGKVVEIPYPVVIDKRTHEVRPVAKEEEYGLPPIKNVTPPRWTPPQVEGFELGPGADFPSDPDPDKGPKGPSRPTIPAALVIPNNLAVLHQFFAVTLMVTNGAPAGSNVTLDSVTALIKPPAELRTVKSLPPVAFNQPVPIVDPTTGVTFLVAQVKGSAEWTMEGLKPGTHTLEVEVHATYKSPGQTDFPLKGTVRTTIVVHDPRFNINFSHPDTVRKGVDYSTYSFITNMSAVPQTIHVTNGLQACSVNPTANLCRLDGTPEFHDLTIPAGEMRMVEYKVRPGITGHVYASAGSVSDDNITASVQLFMGVSESGIPLSPVTLVMPYYAKYVSQDLISPNLQLLGLGYSLATAPLTQALASHPRVIKTDVFQRAVDIARAGQRIYLGETANDAMAHMSLDLLGNDVELREWDDLRRQEKSGRAADASVARELEKGASSGNEAFVSHFAAITAHRAGYVLALLRGSGELSAKIIATGASMSVPNEATAGWVRNLPWGSLSKFNDGELAMIGRWTGAVELAVTPAATGSFSLDVIYPNSNDGSLLRAHVDFTGTAGKTLTLDLDRGTQQLNVRDDLGGIAAVPTVVAVSPEPIHLIGARQDMHLNDQGHQVSVLFSRPVTIADGDDWLKKFHGQIILNKDGVNYTAPRPLSAAALQGDGRVVNVTFDHALSQNASYSLAVDPVLDPLTTIAVNFPQAITPVIDNDAPGGIIYGHVLKADNTPIANAEVVLQPEGAQQFDLTPSDGSFLFEFVPRDIDNNINGTYSLRAITTEGKETKVEGAVRLPGRVHFVNLVFLGRGSAQGYVRYDNGDPVVAAHVVIGSTMFDQFRSGDADATGFYQIDDLPVGPLTFAATDKDGNVTFGASEIKTPGQVLIKDLSIYRRPFPGVATVRGIVLRSDTNGPVAGAHVGVYSQGYGLIDGFTDSSGKFEFTKVPSGFVTVLASEWSVSMQSVAQDFDLAADETKDVSMTLNVAPSVPLAQLEGDVTRENPLHPGDANFYEKVAGALVKVDNGQAVTADANGHFVYQPLPTTFAGHTIAAYDPSTSRTASTVIPALDPAIVNRVPIFISAASGYGKGTIRVRVSNAAGFPIAGLRVLEPGFPPVILAETGGPGVYQLTDVPVGATINIWAISTGGTYGDQFAQGSAKVEFNGHIASLNLRFGGQGTVRVKLVADIDVIGDVAITYPVWDEEDQGLGSKTVTANSAKNGVADYAVFSKVPALLGYSVASQHPVYGYAGQSGKLGFDGDVQSIILQLNKLSTVRGYVYAIDGRTPVPGAIVHIEDGRQAQGTYATLPDGSFVFFNEPASTGFRVVAEITQDGIYRTGYGSGSTPALGGPVNNVPVILRTQGSVDGKIVYAGFKRFDPNNPANNIIDDTPNDLSDNAPVPLAKFSLREFDFPSRTFGTTSDPLTADAQGRFSINNLFTGPLRVTAEDPGNQENRGSWTGTLTQEGERLTAYVGIGTTGFGSVTVNVTDPNNLGAAVYNAEVTIYRGSSVFDFATTDGNGVARFDQLPVGTYSAAAYSKALGRSGSTTASFTISANTDTPVRIDLVFSGKVTGKLSDPQAGGAGVPGAPVTLTAFNYSTRTSTETTGNFLFEGVREGTFTLDAKDTLSNRHATASHSLSQADPEPNILLQLEPTEVLHVAAYLPADNGTSSGILAPIVNLDVTQRNGDFIRSLQGNDFQMPGLFLNSPYSIDIHEVGGAQREIRYSGSFPAGNAANPLKLVFPAYGSVEVHVMQASLPAANAKVSVSGGGRSATVYTDSLGVAVASGIGLGPVYIQAVTVDGAFSGSASSTLASQSTPAQVSITLGAYAGVTGYVEAETGGPSVGTRVIASFGRVLEVLTDSSGRYTFQGIPTSTNVSLVYMGPDDVTVGARQSYGVTLNDASKLITLPNVKLDATPPLLLSFFPSDGAQNVSPDTTLKFTFSEQVQTAYINNSYFQLIPADSANALNCSFTAVNNPDGTYSITMTPPPAAAGEKFPLKSNTLYRIIVSGEIRDLTGNKMPATRGGSFITSDYAEPHVVKISPAVTTPLQAATTFIFTFNEPIDPAPWQPNGGGQFHLYKISAAGPSGTVLADLPGRVYVDPATGLSLNFAPNDTIEAQSFYRVVFSGIRDLQGNASPEQTFHFFSFDSIKPVVAFVSPVPDTFPLISGVQYVLKVNLTNPDASAATDVARVDYFRMDGTAQTFLSTVTASPFSYTFVAPDVPEGGSTLTMRAVATDQSGNFSDPATITWNVQPNKPPQSVAVVLTPTSAYASNKVNAAVSFTDEGTFATVQVDASGTNSDNSTWTKSLVKQVTRTSVDAAWPASTFDFDLPSTLKEGTTATFNAAVTDVRGQKGTASATLNVLADAVNPAIISVTPAAETRFVIGTKYQILTLTGDNESGVKQVTFALDGQVITVPVTDTTRVTPGLAAHTWSFSSGLITVPAKNVDTRIPITVTATDYHGNTISTSVEVIYVGVNDPTVPKGSWLCPVDRATFPASASFPVTLQVKATDDIAVTGVKFVIPNVASPVVAARVGTTDTYQATVTLATPAAGTPYTLTAIVSDADSTHDVTLTTPIELVDVDITIDNRTQAVTSTDVATYSGKSIVVTGAAGKFVPHVALTLKNLLVLNGARVETLATTTTAEQKLDLTISDHLYIDCTSSVDVSSKGYLGGWAVNSDGSNTKNNDSRGMTAGNTATGGPTPGASASYAGLGGEISGGITNATYGSFTNPFDLGTGGAGTSGCCTTGGSGGGAIRIIAGPQPGDLGIVSIAGNLKANGQSGTGIAEAGSGGSINVTAKQFIAGPNARITANGGDDDANSQASRGAGGGRIAINAADRFSVDTMGLQIQARGGDNHTSATGASYVEGGAGTIYTKRPGETFGELYVSSFDEQFPTINHLTRPTPLAAIQLDRLELGQRALVRADGNLQIGSAINDRTAATIDSSAVLVLPADQPVITVTPAPASGSTLVQGATITPSYSATSLAGIGTVTLAWTPVTPNRVDSYFSYPSPAAANNVSLAIPATTAPGAATLTLTATDRAGRSVTSSAVPYTIATNQPPVITKFLVSPLSLYPGKSVTATISATDELSVTKLTLTSTINNGTPATQTKTPNTAVVTDSVFTVTVPIDTPGDAPMTLTVGAEDNFAGHTPTTQTTPVTILKDTNPPSLTVTSPLPNALFNEGTGATIAVRANASDLEVGVKTAFVVFDGTQYPLTSGSAGSYSADLPVPSVDGVDIVTKQLVVTVKDYEGNTKSSDPITIQIKPLNDPNAPVVAWSCPTAGALFPAGYSAKLRMYAIGNNVGNGSNGIQKVEFFINGSNTPITGAPVSGLANYYEATFPIPSDATAGTQFAVRGVATNASGLSNDVSSSFTVVAGTKITADTTISASDVSFDNKVVIVQSGTTTIIGAHTFDTLIVLDGAKVTHPATDAVTTQKLALNTTTAVFVSCSGTIDVSGRGYLGNTIYPGATAPGFASGGSHMGYGGVNALPLGSTYGSLYQPQEAGGGGQRSGSGGGIITINTPSLTNDGAIRANGANVNGCCDGSAGGSIWIRTTTLAGSGSVNAEGGNWDRTGGGGAIAIEYTAGSGTLLNNLTAWAGGSVNASGGQYGGAGTIYVKGPSATFGTLTINNNGHPGGGTQGTDLPSLGSGIAQSGSSGATLVTDRAANIPAYFNAHWVELRNASGAFKGLYRIGAISNKTVTLAANGSDTPAAAAGDQWRGVYRFDAVTVAASESLVSIDPILIGANHALTVVGTTTANQFTTYTQPIVNEDVTIVGHVAVPQVKATNLTIETGAVLTSLQTSGTTAQTLSLDITGSINVKAGGAIDVSGRGYGGNVTYPGASLQGFANGGSHIGYGGLNASPLGSTFGSVYQPQEAGGGGQRSGNGGGILLINTPSLLNDGAIRANGANANGCCEGSAGGSIWIRATSVSGIGTVEAQGGNWDRTGGGGAIAIEYTNAGGTILNNLSAWAGGSVNASGGQYGGAGSVYVKSATSTYGSLTINNNNHPNSQITELPSLGNGIAQSGSGGATLVTDRATNIPAYFGAHWVEIRDASGAFKGVWRVSAINAKTLTLAQNSASDVPNVAAGDQWRGVYRFDNVTIAGNETFYSGDPILVGASRLQTVYGTTLPNVFTWYAQALTGDDLSIIGHVMTSQVKAATLTLQSGSILTSQQTSGTTPQTLSLDISGSINVKSGAAIDVSGRGYAANVTYPGATLPGFASGGSHIGTGGVNSLPTAGTFGSVYQPQEAGGGGQRSGNGGGVLLINTPSLVNDGAIRANGANVTNCCEGSAGGSIWIRATSVSGNGTVEVQGGNWDRTGGGGALAIEYTTATGNILNNLSAWAGGSVNASGGQYGGAGSIYLKTPASTYGSLTINNNNHPGSQSTELPSFGSGIAQAGSSGATLVTDRAANIPAYFGAHWVEIRDASGAFKGIWRIASINAKTATLSPNNANDTPNVAGGDQWRGVYRFDAVTVAGNETLFSLDPIYVGASRAQIVYGTTQSGVSTTYPAIASETLSIVGHIATPQITATTLSVESGASITSTQQTLSINASGSINVKSGAAIDVSGRGYGANTSYPGAGLPGFASGGSHIGYGGLNSGPLGATYGSIDQPQEAGAGGQRSGNGGGVLTIVSPSLTNDGAIRANGVNATNCCEGSGGGSIWIRTTALAGNGTVEVQGSNWDRTGGGGALAIEYSTVTGNILSNLSAWTGGSAGAAGGQYGGAGTIFLKAPGATYGALTINNNSHPSSVQATELPSIGNGTAQAGSSGATLVTNRAANIPSYFLGHWIQLRSSSGTVKGTWRIATANAKTVTLAPNASETIDAQPGDTYRGVYRLDSLKLRSARLSVEDLLDLGTAVDSDASSSIVGNNQGAPVINTSLVTLSSTATGSSVIGTAGAVTDADKPVTMTATNTTSNNTYVVTANADGSFTIPVQGNAGETIVLKAKDGNAFPLESPVVTIGQIATSTPTSSQIDRTTWTSDGSFRARRLANDATRLLVASNNGSGSDKLVVLSIADPARPTLLRTITTSNGVINDIALTSSGWAVVAANDLLLIDLDNPTSTPINLGDQGGWYENAVTLTNGYAITAVTNYNDGRVRVYDISTPASGRYLRDQTFISGVTFRGLATMGNYLIAMSPDKPNGVGHDVVVIDKSNIYGLAKVGDLDIPNFDAYHGYVSGTKLFVTSLTSPDTYVVDLSNPAAPAVLGKVTLSGNAGGMGIIKNDAFIGAGSQLVDVDVSNPAAPAIAGASTTGGTAYDVALQSPYAYVANDSGLSIVPITTAPQIDPTRVAMSLGGATLTITGAARAVTGIGAITIEAKDATSNVTVSGQPVASDGTFSVNIGAAAGDAITLEATDAAGRKSGAVSLGIVPFGSGVSFLPITPAISEAGFHARTLATDGTNLIVGGYADGGSTKVLLYDVTSPATPVYKRTVAVNNGAVTSVAIANGYAFIGANDLMVLDLSSNTSTPVNMGDPGWYETDVAITGGYAFDAISNYTDGRIRVWDVSNPPTTRFVRDQTFISGVNFSGVALYGSQYLLAFTPDRPNGAGHDLVVIDRSNINSFVKVADIDIGGANFNAFRGKVLGKTLFLAGTNGGVAVVDLTDPKNPVVKTTLATAEAYGVDFAGSTVAIADGSAGVTFLDATNQAAPINLGTQAVGGYSWSVAFNRGSLYVANEQGIAVIQNIATSPFVYPSLIGITATSGTTATVTGVARSVTGVTPLTVEVKDTATGASLAGQTVASDGSFSVLIPAAAGEQITVEATDPSGRKSGAIVVGTVPFGSGVTNFPITGSISEPNFHARTLATDGTTLIVGGYADGGSTKVLLFDVTNPALPVYKRTVTLNDGAVNSIAISKGFAFIGANDIMLLDLSSNSSTPVNLGDPGWYEFDLAINGGYLFSAITNYTDGRIRVYEVNNPATSHFLRDQTFISGVNFSGLATLGNNYLLAFTPDRPNGVGHDLVVIDRTNINSFSKVADVDIAGATFNAYRGKVIGNILYLAGTGGQLAIVDMTNPLSPVVKNVLDTPGNAYGDDGSGTLVAVADGSAGVTFLDGTDPANPIILGSQFVGGNAWSLVMNRGNIYVANETGLAVIQNVGAAPVVAPGLVTISGDGNGNATITGLAKAVTGTGSLTADVKNVSLNTAAPAQNVAADGSFTATLTANPGETITVEATDAAGRKSGPVVIGTVPFGSGLLTIPITPAISENNYHPRTLASDGKFVIVGGYQDGGTTKLLVFDIAGDPANPVLKRTVTLSDGAINQVAISNGYAIVAANDVMVLDLNNAASTPVNLGDPGWFELDLAIADGYAFTAVSNYTDGRIRTYDVADPSHAHQYHDATFISGVNFTGLTTYGTGYLIASTADKPGGVGHDVVILDRRDPNALVKVGDLDIPGFDGFRGKVVGTTFYLGGVSGGLAVVDVSDPKNPVLKQIVHTPGDPFSADAAGTTLAVADGSAGVSFLDITNPVVPHLIGTQPTGGTVWATAFSRGNLYAVNEQSLVVVQNVTTSPILDKSLLTLTTDGTTTTFTGAAKALTGVGPLTVFTTNTSTSATSSTTTVANDGSFLSTLAALPGSILTLTATDKGNRAGTTLIGQAPFGTVSTFLAGQAQASNDAGFRARRVATDGNVALVADGSGYGLAVPGSRQLLKYNLSGGAVQSIVGGSGTIRDLTVSGGYVYIAADDLGAISLSDPTNTLRTGGDPGWFELSVAVQGTFAFTTVSNYGDGRVRVYNLSNPAQPVFVRDQSIIGSTTFLQILKLSTSYLVAITPDKPGGVGHDVVVIDSSNPNAMIKTGDFDIPNFNGFDGAVDGATLYVVGGASGVAVVDLSAPASPVLKSIITTPGFARGVAVSGTNEIAIADGSGGVTFVDVTNKTSPVIKGTQYVTGNTTGVAVTGKTVLAASDQYFNVITRP